MTHETRTTQATERGGFTLMELLTVIGIIAIAAAIAIPAISTIFTSGADAQAESKFASYLMAARAQAIQTANYVGVHVQPADAPNVNSDIEGRVYMAVVEYQDGTQSFQLAEGFRPVSVPGGYAFGEISSDFVYDSGENEGDYKVSITGPPDAANSVRDFTSFTIVFSPSGSIAKGVEAGGTSLNIKMDAAHPLFAGAEGTQRLWDGTVANGNNGAGEPGASAVTLFHLDRLMTYDWDGDGNVPEDADARKFLNENGQIMPINVYTGQLFRRPN